MKRDRERALIRFAENVLALLSEGKRTATYKYAVLLALIDLCLEKTSPSGAPPALVTTRELAEKVIELYWPHTVPYDRKRAVLKQIKSRKDAGILSLIREFRRAAARDPSAPLGRVRQSVPERFEALVRDVEWQLIRNPLPRLQTIGRSQHRFLYQISWTAQTADQMKPSVRRYQRGGGGSFDNRILFVGHVGEYLCKLNGLLRPLIQRRWAQMVAELNQLEESRLERFLFGADRTPTKEVRDGLREIQNDRCFYCDSKFADSARSRAQVDHFIPWSRYANDDIENLVAAHERCNADKRDFLAAAPHVARWTERLRPELSTAVQLRALAQDVRWPTSPERSLNVARALDLDLSPDAKLWLREEEFVEPDLPALMQALG